MKPHLSPLARAILDGNYARICAITGDFSSRQVSDSEKKSYCAIRTATDALAYILPTDKALPALREAINSPPEDLELFFLLLSMSVNLSNRLNRMGDARRFSRLMKELLDGIPHPELKAFWLLHEHFRLLASLHPDLRTPLDEALALDIPRDTEFWGRLKLRRAETFLMSEMDFPAVEKDIAEMEPFIQRHPRFANSLQFLKVRLHQRAGNTDEALTLLAPFSSTSHALPVNMVRLMLLFDAGRWEEYDRELETLEKSPVPSFLPARIPLMRALKALGKGFPESARDLARKTIPLIKTSIHPHVILHEAIQILASAELALRNPKAARVLLEMIDPKIFDPYVRVYWMRLFLLEDDDARAAAVLKRILDIGRHGTGILARELREAHEVSAHQIEKLRLLASRLPSSPLPPTVSVSPSESIPFPTLLGENTAIRKVKTLIRKYAPLDTTVLITGETGTGKDVTARLIHESSSRAGHPFTAVNCASISDSLMEAELFGYVKGAFTGASSNHDGLFTTTGKGTLFLDDVESMPARLQAGLLRVLESGEIRPVGGTRIRKTTARIVAATNTPLDGLVKKGTFREDLFYRLARFEITLPPLRERKDDIPLLAKHFLTRIYASHTEGAPTMGESLLHAFEGHDWRGNVRELENEIQRIAILAGDRRVLEADLFRTGSSPAGTPSDPGRPLIRPSTRERRERLRALFREHPHLTFQEVVDNLPCGRCTAFSDLKNLENEKFIHRVHRADSTRALYYTRTK
ncbi:MAG: sigma 54-interacting transcriptional regulator [Planctomycetota bacterium]